MKLVREKHFMSNDFIKAVAFASEKHKNQRRKDGYFTWAGKVINGVYGTNPKLEKIFDELMSKSDTLVL